MRIYQNFKETIPEIRRDLVEMGIKVWPQTYQDKDIHGDPNFQTLELQNYVYTVVHPNGKDLKPSQPWADAEWSERLSGIDGEAINPGDAWKLRKEVWTEFLDRETKDFAYSYSERFAKYNQVEEVIKRLKKDPESRQLFISVWNPSDSQKLGGLSRVPCSLGYLIQCRKNQINITYLQRSCDWTTHFINDIYLAYKLQEHIAVESKHQIGTFTHWIGSLHLFRKDAQGVF